MGGETPHTTDMVLRATPNIAPEYFSQRNLTDFTKQKLSMFQ